MAHNLICKCIFLALLTFKAINVHGQCQTAPTTAGTHTLTFTSNCASQTLPSNATNIIIECWGGGGGGGGCRTLASSGAGAAGGGGGGGAYSMTTGITVASSPFAIVVGAAGTAGASGSTSGGNHGGNGGTSSVNSTLGWAAGGTGGRGIHNGGNAQTGTTAGGSTGSGTVYSGGTGSRSVASGGTGKNGGAGGGGAGTGVNGSNGETPPVSGVGKASALIGGNGGASGGGKGGNGGVRAGSATGGSVGIAGVTIGAGGGGGVAVSSGSAATAVGGAGARGEVRITYTIVACLTPTLTYTSNTVSYCANTAITSNSPSITNGPATGYSVSPALPAGLAIDATTGIITGTPTTATAAGNYTVTMTTACSSTTCVLNITVQSADNNAGEISLAAEACLGSTVTIGNVTAATTGTPASSVATYKYYWTLATPVSWNLYETTTSSTSTLPTAVTNTAGDYIIARNSLFTCGVETNNGNTVKNITINPVPAAGLPVRTPTGPQYTGTTYTINPAVTGGTSPYTYTWTTTPIIAGITLTPSSGSSSTFVTTVTNTNAYTSTPVSSFNVGYTVTDDNGCQATSSPLSPLVAPEIQPLSSFSVCQGSTATTQMTTSTTMQTISGANGYNGFNWSLSPVGAGSINSSGLITWNSSFNGTATVTVYAIGAGSSATVGTQNSPSKTATITVTASPTASITSSVNSLCHGNTFSLGGSVIATGAWTMNLSDGSTVTGTGSGTWSRSVTPTTNTTYTISSLTDASCTAVSLTGSTILNLPTVTTALAPTSTATCIVNGNNWIHFYDVNGKLIVSINPNGNNLGSVTAESYVDGASIVTQACGSSLASDATAVLGRRWHITPTNNLPAYIRFPFSSGELLDLANASAATTENPLDNVSSISGLKLSKYSGGNQDGSWSNNCADGGTILIPSQMANGAVSTANAFVNTISGTEYVQFSVPGFSEFWLHNSIDPSALPVELTNLSASCDVSNEVVVNWTTASEQNSDKFIVEKSRDLVIWEVTEELPAAGNSNYSIGYTSTDQNPFHGVSYYRLVQQDNNGAQHLFGPISVPCSADQEITVFPNPSHGSFTVEIVSPESMESVKAQITDLTGKLIVSKEISIKEGKNQVLFDGLNLQSGTYIVNIMSGNQTNPVKVTML